MTRRYERYANCIGKAVDLETFFDIVKGIEKFRLAIASLPSRTMFPTSRPAARMPPLKGRDGPNRPVAATHRGDEKISKD